MSNVNNYTVLHEGHMSKNDKNRLNQYSCGLIWLVGLAALGNSTITYELEKRLYQQSIRTY